MVYRLQKPIQLSFESFNTGLGTPISPNNDWVQLANQIPWLKLEEAYRLVFSSKAGRAGKPFRELYGALLIKQKARLSDRELLDAIRDTPAFQYFMGFPDYQAKRPFTHVTLVHFCERIAPIFELIRNIMLDSFRGDIQQALPDKALLITDATAVPVHIKYPQDAHLLNEARLNLEGDIKQLAKQLHQAPPRTYKRIAHQEWTAYSRKPRRWAKTTRKQIKKQLQYVRRDLRYVDERLAQGGKLTKRQQERLATIRKVYEQQTFMYVHHTHQVDNRIVSLSGPFIRPIKRGKAKAPVEFGPKINCSIMDGIVDIEHYSYQAFNESADLKATLDHYQDVHGYYPDIALADTLYRAKENIAWCKKHHIALNGPRLGRNPKHVDPQKCHDDKRSENRRRAIERELAFIKAKKIASDANICETISSNITLNGSRIIIRKLFKATIDYNVCKGLSINALLSSRKC